MTGVVDAMCALEAWRKHGVSTIAEQLAELEETGDDVDDSDLAKTLGQNLKEADDNWRKLRQRHLGTTVEKALKLAQATMTVTAWDSDPMVFGMPDGGATYITMSNPTNPTHQLDGEPTDYLTRKLGATPGPMTPDVRKFLDWFTDGDLIYENALQIWLAASLFPGNVGDKAHILAGDGGTGKSSLLKAVGKALGDYSGSARANVFVSEKDCHPAELLPFINNRMVILPELPIGALRSDLLKTVTGGDSISVRGMRQNPRTETPNATLWFSANELPSIRMVDNALAPAVDDLAVQQSAR